MIQISHNSYSRDLAGIRDVQIRSGHIVTVWLGYLSTTDTTKLYDTNLYSITSPDDPEYSEPRYPVSVSRFSKGSRSANGPFDPRTLCDQFMHLKVDKPFKTGMNYIINLGKGLIPENCRQTIQFSMDKTPNPGFKLNQLGYSNKASVKLVYLSSYLGDGAPVDLSGYKHFSVINSSSHNVALSGNIQLINDKDPQGNDKLYVLDISGLKDEGLFYIKVNGLGRSYPFFNGKPASDQLYELIARGMFFQRCAVDIQYPYADKWPRAKSHDRIYVPSKNISQPWETDIDPGDPKSGDYYIPEGPREIKGGHHDAGDFDTRLTHMAVSEKLMTLYEVLPEKFHDDQVWVPEHNNGIPDILDEAAWSLLHYETLQDLYYEVRGEFGPVPPGMESYRHPPVLPVTGEGDPLPYYMRKATPYTTFCGAAIFAQAARVFKPFDPEHAKKFLHRATEAYKNAVQNKEVKWAPDNPAVIKWDWEEVYDEKKLSTARAWAAAQLFATTGINDYWNDFEDNYTTLDNLYQNHPWTSIFPILHTKQKIKNIDIVNKLKNKLLGEGDKAVAWITENGKIGYRAACPNKGDWGTANPIMNLEVLFRSYYLTKSQKYLDAIATSIDFELGMNPSEISWMTGAGSVYPMDPLNANSTFDNVQEPLPGIVIFGPGDAWDEEVNKLYPDPENMGFYRRISDVWMYVRGCEYVVDEQQTNMYVAAGILME